MKGFVDKIPKHERDRVRRDLLDYCHRDALATVRLPETLVVRGRHLTFRCISVERLLVTYPVMGLCRRQSGWDGASRLG